MGFLAFLVVLLLDQARPLSPGNRLRRGFDELIDLVRTSTDAGQPQQGWIGWAIVVVSVCGVVLALQWLAQAIHPLLEWLFHVAVLYLVVGFRQTLVVFTEMQVALAMDDTQGARRVFDRWHQAVVMPGTSARTLAADAPIEEVCRESIARALVYFHRGICAPLLCYLLLPGVIGPLLYWASAEMARHWSLGGQPSSSRYGQAAARIHRWIDWLPLRCTAAGFAVAGNFDDSVYCWRGAAAAGAGSDQRGMLIAAAGGAAGLRLADQELEQRWATAAQPFDWPARAVDARSLRTGMKLIYRSMLLWLGLFALLSLAGWFSR